MAQAWKLTVVGEEDEAVELDEATVQIMAKVGATRPVVEMSETGVDFATLEAPEGTPDEVMEAVARGIHAALEEALARHAEQ